MELATCDVQGCIQHAAWLRLDTQDDDQRVRRVCVEHLLAAAGPSVVRQGPHALAHDLLVESAVDYALFLLDADGHIMSWNQGGRRLLGYTAEDVVGRHFRLF